MSIHVTVNGNPVSICRRTTFADREKIRKQERDRRKRLRIEQVRQQSRDISSSVLEKTKELTRKELNQLEKNENSVLKRLHDKRIMEIQQQYEESMAEIGMAHEAALKQPKTDVILEARKRKNEIASAQRGREAIEKLKMTKRQLNASDKKRDRLRQVRDIEDIRSAMVSNIAKVSKSPSKKLQQVEEKMDSPIIIISSAQPMASKSNSWSDPDAIKPYEMVFPKKKEIRGSGIKSPGEIIVKTNGKVITQRSKSPRRVVVEVHQEDNVSRLNQADVFNEHGEHQINADSSQTDAVQYVICPPDNQRTSYSEFKTRQQPSMPKVLTSKHDSQYLEYNPNDYRHQTSGGSASSSVNSLLSDDSSYFSDAIAVAPTTTPTPIFSETKLTNKPTMKPQTVDAKNARKKNIRQHKTHQVLVEKTDIRNEMNADERARLITEQEKLEEKKLCNERRRAALNQQKRGAQALSREKICRNYANLMKDLDDLKREEKKLQASKISDSKIRQKDFANKSRRKEIHDFRQKMMDHAFDDAVNGRDSDELLPDRIITLSHQNEADKKYKCASSKWEHPESFHQDSVEEEDTFSRNELILEMLKKVERKKIRLLKEYGVALPEEILRTSMAALFNESWQQGGALAAEVRPKTVEPVERQPSPEIQVINLSKSEADKPKKCKKDKKLKQNLTKKRGEAGVSDKSEIAVQTSRNDSAAEDKSVQVEMHDPKIKHTTIARKSTDSDKREYVEPIITIITRGELSSNESIPAGIVINVDANGRIQAKTQKTLPSESSPPLTTTTTSTSISKTSKTTGSSRTKARSLPSSSPVKGASTNTLASTSAPTSRAESPNGLQESTDSTSQEPKEIPKRSPRKIKKKTAEFFATHRFSEDDNRDFVIEHPRRHQRPASSTKKSYGAVEYQISYTDNSEASSSYASLSADKSAAGVFKNNISTSSILQLLDSSISDSMRLLAREVTPVSTPETPASHIMNVPSNLAQRRIPKILKYSDKSKESKMARKRAAFVNLQESRQELSQESTDSSQRNVQDASDDADTRNCTCKNRICRHLINSNVKEIMRHKQDLSQYELMSFNKCDELQIQLQERVETLTNRINKMRNTDHNLEPSMLSSPVNDLSALTGFRKMNENIERANENLLRIHTEFEKEEIARRTSPNLSPIAEHYEELRRFSPEKLATQNYESKPSAKPRIIENKRVHVELERFKQLRDRKKSEKQSEWRSDNMVEKLSHELLEQSKKIEKNKLLEDTSSGDETALRELPTMSPGKSAAGIFTSSPMDAEQRGKQHVSQTKTSSGVSSTEEENFVPILADIRKVTQENRTRNGTNNRLLHPNLSTIEEQDTPDTGTRSIGSVRASPRKSQRPFNVSQKSHQSISTAINNHQIHINNNNIPILNLGERSSSSTSFSPSKEKNSRPILKELAIEESLRESNDDNRFSPKLDNKQKKMYENYNEKKNGKMMRKQVLVTSSSLNGINDENVKIDESVKSLDSFLIHCSARNIEIKSDKITTSSSTSSFSRFSGTSDTLTTPTSDTIASPPEKLEDYLMGVGLNWLVPVARKTREACALSSSSGSDLTIAMTKRTKSPIKKISTNNNNNNNNINNNRNDNSNNNENNIINNNNNNNNNATSALPGFSDVSSISIREANKSTEMTVLMKGRTSTPNISNFHYTSEKSSIVTASTSGGMSLPDYSDSIIANNLSLFLKT